MVDAWQGCERSDGTAKAAIDEAFVEGKLGARNAWHARSMICTSSRSAMNLDHGRSGASQTHSPLHFI